MKSLLLIVLVGSFSLYAATGAGARGGGLGYLSTSGEVKFKDISPKSTMLGFLYRPMVKRKLYSKNRKVKKLFTLNKKSEFFDCAAEKFRNSGYEALEALAPHLKSFEVHETYLRLGMFFKELNYTENDNYFPIASYVAGRVLLNKRYYDRMSKRGKCALAIHEAFRIYDDVGFDSIEWRYDDIEGFTRLVLDGDLKKSDPMYYKKDFYIELLSNGKRARRVIRELLDPPPEVIDGSILVGLGYDRLSVAMHHRNIFDDKVFSDQFDSMQFYRIQNAFGDGLEGLYIDAYTNKAIKED